MAVLTRLETITEVRLRVGRKAQSLNLVYAYDAITQMMSTRYPLIPHQRATGSCVGATAYITPPSVNVRHVEKFMVGSTLSEIEFKEPELFNQYKGATNASPTMWTYQRDQTTPYTAKLVYLYPTPDSTYGYALYYGLINAKSSVDGSQHSMTEYMDESVILGIMWKAAEIAGEFKKASIYKGLFLKDLAERARVVVKQFRTVE